MKVSGESERLVNEITNRQSELGMTVKGYRVKGNQLDLIFYPHYPMVNKIPKTSAGAKYLVPIIWGIIVVAGIIGAGILAWQLQQTAQQILPWVGVAAVLGTGALAVYLVSKI